VITRGGGIQTDDDTSGAPDSATNVSSIKKKIYMLNSTECEKTHKKRSFLNVRVERKSLPTTTSRKKCCKDTHFLREGREATAQFFDTFLFAPFSFFLLRESMLSMSLYQATMCYVRVCFLLAIEILREAT
jgi:hypothetical protein